MPIALDRLATAFLPQVCVLCRAPCSQGFCGPCGDLLRRVPDPCPRCALPRSSVRLHRCASLAGVDRLIAPFVFEAPLSDVIHAFKYRRERAIARPLALLLLRATGEHIPAADALIPVPLHGSRLRERTFNQADEIARTLSARTGIPLLVTMTRRVVATPAQALLAPEQRARNLRDAFSVAGRPAGFDLVVVDDVVTTGATAAALARGLRARGAASVSVWAVARTLPGNARTPQAGAAGRPLRKT